MINYKRLGILAVTFAALLFLVGLVLNVDEQDPVGGIVWVILCVTFGRYVGEYYRPWVQSEDEDDSLD